MAFLKPQEIRSMAAADRATRLAELRQDLMHERGVAAMGGSPPSPGKIRQIRRQIARILTIQNEEVHGIRGAPKTTKPGRPAGRPAPAKAPKPKPEAAAKPAAPMAKSPSPKPAKAPAAPAGAERKPKGGTSRRNE